VPNGASFYKKKLIKKDDFSKLVKINEKKGTYHKDFFFSFGMLFDKYMC